MVYQEGDVFKVQAKVKSKLKAAEKSGKNIEVGSRLYKEIIQDMIKTRNSARERELRQLTYEFGSFIKDAAYNTDTDEEFLRNLLKQSLQQLSNSLEPRTIRKKGESMIDVWVRAMEEAVYKN